MKIKKAQLKLIIENYLSNVNESTHSVDTVSNLAKISDFFGKLFSNRTYGEKLNDQFHWLFSAHDLLKNQKFISNLKNYPAIESAILDFAYGIDKLDALLTHPALAKTFSFITGVVGPVVGVLTMYLALPLALIKSIENSKTAEGVIKKRYELHNFRHGKPNTKNKLTRDLIEQDMIDLIAMDMIYKNMSDDNSKPSVYSQVLEYITNDVAGDILRKRNELKASGFGTNELSDELASKLENTNIKHEGIMLGLICDVASGVGGAAGVIDSSSIISLLNDTFESVSSKGN